MNSREQQEPLCVYGSEEDDGKHCTHQLEGGPGKASADAITATRDIKADGENRMEAAPETHPTA